MSAEPFFIVVITAHNNGAYAHTCLSTACSQEYARYAIVYVDDCSTDNSPAIVTALRATDPRAANITYIRTQTRQKKLANLYRVIHSLAPETIVIELDGDDALAHPHVLATYAASYRQTGAWFVYANYRNEPAALAKQLNLGHFNAPTPWLVKITRTFRQYPWVYSGLRSYYAGLFQRIARRDLLYEEQFFPVCHDLAYTYPMLEMTGNRIARIDEPLLIRHIDSPINDFKNPDTTQANALRTHIRKQQRYARLDRLF